jgi:hypothetical protein
MLREGEVEVPSKAIFTGMECVEGLFSELRTDGVLGNSREIY